MKRKYREKILTDKPFDINLLDCNFIGRGNNGAVFLLPGRRVIKICFDVKGFYREVFVLKRVNGNKYFPQIYDIGGNYIIRDYVEGECLMDYIYKNGLSYELSLKIILMLEEFEKLGFKKIDIRCRDIYIQPDNTLKIIDPKKCFSKERTFPGHLSKGLHKLGVLNIFLEVLKKERPELYGRWGRDIQDYIRELNLNASYKNKSNTGIS